MAAEPFFMALMKVQIVEKDLRADALVSWMRSMTATPKAAAQQIASMRMLMACPANENSIRTPALCAA